MVLSFRVSWSSFLFYGLAKFKGLHDYALIGIKNIKKHGCSHMTTPLLRARARIGVEIIYLSSGFVGHGGNRA